MAIKESGTFVKLKNPYTFGVPVRGEGNFFGREEELQLIFDTLENVPRGQKQDMVVLGPRRIGKSSLLYRLVDLLTPSKDFVPVYVDIQNIKPRKTRLLFLKILQKIKEGYEQKNLVGELPSFSTLESERIPGDLEFFALDEDLSRLNNTIATRNLPRLVLMFDEVELLVEFGGQDTLDWFRSLIQNLLYTIFIVAGSERLYSLTQDYGSPFYNIFKTIELRSLTTDAARKLITVPAATVGLEISSSDINKILEYAGNNPYFIQGICHYLVESLNQKHQYRAYSEDVNQVIQKAADDFSAQFNYIWGGISQVQRTVLYLLAKRMNPQTIDALMADLPQFEDLVQSRHEEQKIFEDLVEQQILKIENGIYYSFIIPLFANWIRSKVDDETIVKPVTLHIEGITDLNTRTRLRRDLYQLFTDSDLDILVFDHFPTVYDRFGRGMGKDEKIALLLDYVVRVDQIDKLSDLLEEFKQTRQVERTARPTIFISYSHKDEMEKDVLLSHLSVLQSAGLINLWSDDRIGPGTDWEVEIRQAIARAKVAILHITADFLTSDFILDKQIPTLLERYSHDDLTVMPVIAKPCAWETVDWLRKMEVRPRNGKPIWREGGRYADEELAKITEEIAAIVRNF